MDKFIFQLLILVIFWYLNFKRKKSVFTASSFLIFLYCISAFCGIFCLELMHYSEPYSDSYWLPMLQFVGTLLLFLLPFVLFVETKTKQIVLPTQSILNLFSSVIIILSFYAIFYYLGTAVSILLSGNLGAARDALSFNGVTYVQESIFNTIGSVSASFYVFALFLFFIYSAIGGYKLRRALLFISSFSYPIQVLCYVGRDGAIYWMFSFIFFFLLLKDYLDDIIKKQIQSVFLWAFLVLLIPFVLISVSRFGESDTGTSGGLLSYIGQSFINGPLFFGIENKPYNGGAAFPLFFELTGIKPHLVTDLNQIGDWCSWYFSTFIVSLYINLKELGLYLTAISLFVIFISLFGFKKVKMRFPLFFIYILFFQVYSEGIFYFREYTRGGNLFIVICFFLFCFFPMKKSSNVLKTKK